MHTPRTISEINSMEIPVSTSFSCPFRACKDTKNRPHRWKRHVPTRSLCYGWGRAFIVSRLSLTGYRYLLGRARVTRLVIRVGRHIKFPWIAGCRKDDDTGSTHTRHRLPSDEHTIHHRRTPIQIDRICSTIEVKSAFRFPPPSRPIEGVPLATEAIPCRIMAEISTLLCL